VIGVECSQHLSDVAAETVVTNGYGRECMIINKDIRRVTQADTQPFFQGSKANIWVFEVFDVGLIGEGILHLLQAANRNILQPNSVMEYPKS